MDDYLPKPIQRGALEQMIARVTTGKRQEAREEQPALLPPRTTTTAPVRDGAGAPQAPDRARTDDAPDIKPAVNMEALVARYEGDLDLMARVVEIYLRDAARLGPEMRAALAHKDARALELAAHRLRGTLVELSAAEATEAALHLEQLARRGALDEVAEALTQLECAMTRLGRELAPLVRCSPAEAEVLKPAERGQHD